MDLYFLASRPIRSTANALISPRVSEVPTQFQDDELGTGLDIADLILSHTLIKTLIRLHQSQHLQIMLILGETQKTFIII